MKEVLDFLLTALAFGCPISFFVFFAFGILSGGTFDRKDI